MNVKNKIEYQDSTYDLNLPSIDQDLIQSEIDQSGQFYDLEGLQKLQTILPEQSVIIDVGAHVGNHSLFFHKVCGARQVIAYEPQEQLAATCQQTMIDNNIKEGSVVIHNVACVQMRTPLTVSQVKPENLSATKYAISNDGTVPSVILDKQLRDQKIDLLKVSANDMNFLVIIGSEQIIRAHKPIIYTQLADLEKASASAFLRDLGYRISWQSNDRYIFQYDEKTQVAKVHFDVNKIHHNIALFWHQEEPPRHILDRADIWRDRCANFDVTLFSDRMAQEYIEKHYGPEWLALYNDCAIAAMQSDVFRVLWGLQTGGIYSDLTFLPGDDIYFMSSEHSLTALLHPRKGIIRNGVFYAHAGSPALKAIAEKIKQNIKNKTSNSVFMVTGPNVWNLILAETELESFCVRKQREIFDKHFRNNSFPETTRGGPNHWSNLQKHQSIFRSG